MQEPLDVGKEQPIATLVEFERVARSLVGEYIVAVTYVGLYTLEQAVPEWDFGDWHWPAVGIEFKMRSGRTFHVTWDCKIIEYELTLAEGSVRSTRHWLRPLWAVTDHPGWHAFIGTRIESCFVIAADYEGTSTPVPVAMRLSCLGGVVWIAAAAPRNSSQPRCSKPEDVYIASDDIMVLFGDAPARRIGLSRMLHIENT